MMGYVEAARAVWKLYSLGRWNHLEDIGLSEQKHKPLLDAFSSCRDSTETGLSGLEALILLTTIKGFMEACSRLLRRYDEISTTFEPKRKEIFDADLPLNG